MEFKNLKIAVVNEQNKVLKERLAMCETEQGFKNCMSFEGKTYKKNLKEKFTKYLRSLHKKLIEQNIKKIEQIENANDFGGELILTIEWKKSRMRGSNPKVSTNYGYTGSSIGGCGYCKTSTATAQGLNSHLPLLKLLYAKKDKNIKKNNHALFGSGSGYSLLPYFEGGMGVGSHETILNGIGISMQHICSTKNTDVFICASYKR